MKYLVTVRATSTIVVEAENEDEASQIAFTECDLKQFDVAEAEVEPSLEDPVELDRAIRHCNQEIN